MVCGQKNIDHQTDAGKSGFRCTLRVRLGTMRSVGPAVAEPVSAAAILSLNA